MTRYMLLYNGPATAPEDMGPEAAQAEMAKWAAWMEGVGSALIDMGQPMAPGTAVVDDGSQSATLAINGYSILEAPDLEAARKMVDGHPFLSEGEGRFKVEIFELLVLPGM
jgi:hypothetical protein